MRHLIATVCRAAVLAVTTILILSGGGCSRETDSGSAPLDKEVLKKHAEVQRQLHYREAHNK